MDDSQVPVTNASAVPEHGIAVVERLTGVSQHVLRAWERRYRVINPARAESGHRLYSDEDIERLRLVRVVAAGGRRVGQVIGLPLEQLRHLASRDASEAVTGQRPAQPAQSSRGASDHLNAALDAMSEMQPATTFNVLMRAAVALGPRSFIEGVAVPLLEIVGDGWEAGTIRPVKEHSLSNALRRVLTWVLDALPAPDDAPTVIFAMLPGQRHEFGALFAAVIAASRHWNVSYLGGDLPADDIIYAASVAAADVVAVSVIGAADPRAMRRDLADLRRALPASVPLVVGGHAAFNNARSLHSTGAVVLPDLSEWERWLDATSVTLAAQKSSGSIAGNSRQR